MERLLAVPGILGFEDIILVVDWQYSQAHDEHWPEESWFFRHLRSSEEALLSVPSVASVGSYPTGWLAASSGSLAWLPLDKLVRSTPSSRSRKSHNSRAADRFGTESFDQRAKD